MAHRKPGQMPAMAPVDSNTTQRRVRPAEGTPSREVASWVRPGMEIVRAGAAALLGLEQLCVQRAVAGCSTPLIACTSVARIRSMLTSNNVPRSNNELPSLY